MWFSGYKNQDTGLYANIHCNSILQIQTPLITLQKSQNYRNFIKTLVPHI